MEEGRTEAEQPGSALEPDLEARDALVMAHLGLAHYFATRWQRHCPPLLEFDDLLQEGRLGLILAAEAYRPEPNASFGTYAAHFIRGRIVDTIRAFRSPLHVPRRPRNAYFHRRAGAEEEAQLNGEPTLAELATAGAGDDQSLAALVRAFETARSLDAPRFPEGRQGFDIPDPTARFEEAILIRAQLEHLLSQLPEKEQATLRLRYGLDGAEPLVQAEVAALLGTFQSYVSLLEKRGLKKLERLLRAMGE